MHLDGLQVSGPEGACSMRGPAGSRGLFGRKKGREGGDHSGLHADRGLCARPGLEPSARRSAMYIP